MQRLGIYRQIISIGIRIPVTIRGAEKGLWQKKCEGDEESIKKPLDLTAIK